MCGQSQAERAGEKWRGGGPLLLNTRLTSFLLSNKLIDPTMQKAFLPGINGCIEHNMALDEIIKALWFNRGTGIQPKIQCF